MRDQLTKLRKWHENDLENGFFSSGFANNSIDDFLEGISTFNLELKAEGFTMDVSDDGNHDVFQALPKRSDLDAMDRFWRFCQSANSKEQLADNLTALIEELETGRLLPIVLYFN